MPRSTLEEMGCAIATCTPDGRVLDASPPARALLAIVGVGPQPTLPNGLWSLLCSVPSGEAIEWRELTGEGHATLGFTKYPLGAKNSVLLMRDTSSKRLEVARKLHEGRLDASARIVTSLVRRLRRPLAVLNEARPDPSIQRAVRELERVIDGALDVTRLGPPALWSVDVGEAIERAREDAISASGVRDGVFRIEIDGAARWTRGNPFGIELVLRELMVNSLQATSARATIRVAACRTSEEWIDLVVEDDGARIAPSVATRMFDPYFTTKLDAPGLGLTTAREVATDLGGELRHETTTSGTRFVLTLVAGEATDPLGGRT